MKKVLSAILLVSMLTITACSSGAATTTAAGGGSKTETITAKGYGGDLVVKVTASATKIEKIEIEGKNETPNLGATAIVDLPKAIVEKNSLRVDATAGATITSQAVLKAVEEAITKMGFDAAAFKK
jgi:fumarate reductase flavoprotein subunit